MMMQHAPPVQVTAPQDIEEARRKLEEELEGEVKPNAAPDDGGDSGGHGGTLPPPPPPPPKG